MAAYYVKNKKRFRRHFGLGRHFDFFNWLQCFYFYIALELQHILINTVTCLTFATMKVAMCSVTDSGLLCRMSGLVSIANEDNTVTYH
jgi:hypothetical protein